MMLAEAHRAAGPQSTSMRVPLASNHIVLLASKPSLTLAPSCTSGWPGSTADRVLSAQLSHGTRRCVHRLLNELLALNDSVSPSKGCTVGGGVFKATDVAFGLDCRFSLPSRSSRPERYQWLG